jgi:hypothetical protein
VNVVFDGSNVRFNFAIRHPAGQRRPDGSHRPRRQRRSPGEPGEFSQAQLNNALAQTSNNSNAVGEMSIGVDTSYNPSQMQAVFDKVDELILALRR